MKAKPTDLRGLLGFRLDRRSLAAGADLDLTRLLGLGALAREVGVQEAVLQRRARHLDAVSKLEPALEAARRDALIQNVGLALFRSLLLAANRESVLLHLDRKVLIGEAGDRDGNPVSVLAGALDVVGRVRGSRIDADQLIEHREQAVEPDRVAVQRSEIELSHGISSYEATCRAVRRAGRTHAPLGSAGAP